LKIRYGTYIGADAVLKGETAMLQIDDSPTGKVLAQFDSPNLRRAYGWHVFDLAEFKLAEAIEKDDEQ
jgi:hypothetical protein